MFHGLIDCNNFFVSCERLFNPGLNGKPVVVLSNNDGCAISRSNEAKALGIPMGCPAFKIKEYVAHPEDVVVISGNHTFYNDISQRIMYALGREAESIQVYSVDEAFFQIGCSDPDEASRECSELARRIGHDIGIPVSIGIARTKTLAKIASHIAKKEKTYSGNTHILIDPAEIDRTLRATPIEDVWGIGRRLTESLHKFSVFTAHQFAALPDTLILHQYNTTTLRVKREILGESCAEISSIDRAKQSITTSRSFGSIVYEKRQIADAVVNFASHCCTLLRQQNSMAGSVEVHIRGDHNKPNLPYYSNSCLLRLPFPTSDTIEIVNHALIALDNIFREGFPYKKASVMLGGISSATQRQLNLFRTLDEAKSKKLMETIDSINARDGSGTVALAAAAGSRQWTPRKEHQPKRSSVLRIYSGMLLPGDD